VAILETIDMGKPQKAKTGQKKIAKLGKASGVELNETQLDQAAGGLIGLLKPGGLVPAVQ
jgi:hypothetical protein